VIRRIKNRLSAMWEVSEALRLLIGASFTFFGILILIILAFYIPIIIYILIGLGFLILVVWIFVKTYQDSKEL